MRSPAGIWFEDIARNPPWLSGKGTAPSQTFPSQSGESVLLNRCRPISKAAIVGVVT